MSSFAIDDIIGHLNTLKEQEIQLKLKDEQIKKYEDLLLTYKSTRFDDCFLVYSYDEDQENIEIITENFMEFTELAYDHHYLLIAKKESNRNVAIYLMAFDDNCQLESTIDAIDLLIDSKRKQQQDDSSRVLINKEIRIMNKLIEKKSSDYERKITEQWDQHREFFKKTADLERQIGDQTKKVEKYEEQLNKMSTEKKEQGTLLQKITQEYNQMKEKFDELERDNKLRKLFNERLGLMEYYKIGFLNEKNLEITRYSPSILNGLADRFYKKEIEDNDNFLPPLKDIGSLESRRQQVIDYIEFVKINWNNPYSGTDIQSNIHNWLDHNRLQFTYKPSEKEKEVSRKMFLNAFKLENTIGTIHFLPIQYSNCTFYYCFAISNYRIVCWGYHDYQQKAYSHLYNRFKGLLKWTQNTKFATEMEVDDEQSGLFIHTSNKDVFVENEKVVTWIKNNFNLEQQNNTFNGFNPGYSIIPTLNNFFVKLYATSSI